MSCLGDFEMLFIRQEEVVPARASHGSNQLMINFSNVLGERAGSDGS